MDLTPRRETGVEGGDTDRTRGQEAAALTNKRKLFDELMEGVDAMRRQREGKITLRTHEVEDLPPLAIDAAVIRETRISAAAGPQPSSCSRRVSTSSRRGLRRCCSRSAASSSRHCAARPCCRRHSRTRRR